VNLYLDTSSLIKLCVSESGSESVLEDVDEATVVCTSPVAYAETRAALARLRREGALTASLLAAAKREFEEQWQAYLTVDLTVSLCRTAGDFAEKYGLRGFDSIHLASFAEVASRGGVHNARFSSFDTQLNRAASKLLRRLQ